MVSRRMCVWIALGFYRLLQLMGERKCPAQKEEEEPWDKPYNQCNDSQGTEVKRKKPMLRRVP